jgi:hypothetical protein
MNYDSRLQRLEVRSPRLEPLRILVEFVDQNREAQTVLADDRWFQRQDGESERAFIDRARSAVGWPACRAGMPG